VEAAGPPQTEPAVAKNNSIMVGKKDTAGTANAVAAFHHVVAKGDLEKVKDFALVAAPPYASRKECTRIFILHTHTSTHTHAQDTFIAVYIHYMCVYVYSEKATCTLCMQSFARVAPTPPVCFVGFFCRRLGLC